MKYFADLHTHSTASDGQYRPAELVKLAKNRGLEALALTDHDTLDGLEEAAQAGRQLGLLVLRGVELSAREYPNLHILGYGFSPDAPGLRAWSEELKRGRERRKFLIAEYLHQKGVDVPLDEVDDLAENGLVGRPHFARVMLKHGFAATWKEVFDRYLDTEEFHEIDTKSPPAQECIALIRAAGGKVSLAHPYQTGLAGEELEELVQELVSYGLDAIECNYPRYTPEQREHYIQLIEKFGLHMTGGSDFHGERVKADIELMGTYLELDWILEGQNAI